ncbi:hypothetical protein D9M71_425690 [compost metagenome]
MPVGTLGGVQQVRRVGHYQVETALGFAQQVAGDGPDAPGAGQAGIDAGELQGPAIDVQGLYLGLGEAHGDLDGRRARAATDIRHLVDAPAVAGVQQAVDGLDEAIGVRAEEHRIRLLGGEAGVHIEAFAEGRPAHLAAEPVDPGHQHVGGFHQPEDFVVQGATHEGTAPAEHPGQVFGHGVLPALVDARMGQRGHGGEAIVPGLQGFAQLQKGLVAFGKRAAGILSHHGYLVELIGSGH